MSRTCLPVAVFATLILGVFLSMAVSAEPSQRAAGYADAETLVGPLPFLGVHGLVVTADGELLAGSVVGQSLSSVDIETGHVARMIGPPEGMADDIAIAPDGTLVWTSYLAGVLRAQGADGRIRTLADGLPGINSLAFSTDGQLYASQVFLADALYRMDPAGQKAPQQISENMGGLNGFEVGPDGWIYGPLWFKGRIVRLNPDNGTMQTVAEGLHTPAAVNFDSQGQLYAVDAATGQLLRVNTETGETTTIAQLKPSLDNLAIGPDDTIYVSNMADDSIQAVDPDTGDVDTLLSSPLAAPSGLALLDGTLYVADTFAFRRMDTASGDVTDIKRMWASELHYPNSVWADVDTVVLSSWATGTVQVLERDGFATRELLEGFKAPQDAVQLGDGSLLVSELATGALLQVSGDDHTQRTVVVDGLQGPVGLALTADAKTLYLTTLAGNVWQIDTENWHKTRVTNGLAQPEGIAVAPDGALVVMEAGAGRILRIDPASGDKRVVTDGIAATLPAVEGLPPTGTLNDVAVDAAGAIYYTTDGEAGLYRVARYDG